MECAGVIMAFVAKWLKSGTTNKGRSIGFIITMFVSVWMAYYFVTTGQKWLLLWNVSNLFMAGRGIWNNRKVVTC